MDRASVYDKLRRAEALAAGAKTDGEFNAAQGAVNRLHARLEAIKAEEADVPFRIDVTNEWSMQFPMALLNRLNLMHYRPSRMRQLSIMVMMPQRFHKEVFEPRFNQLNGWLTQSFDQKTHLAIKDLVIKFRNEPNWFSTPMTE